MKQSAEVGIDTLAVDEVMSHNPDEDEVNGLKRGHEYPLTQRD